MGRGGGAGFGIAGTTVSGLTDFANCGSVMSAATETGTGMGEGCWGVCKEMGFINADTMRDTGSEKFGGPEGTGKDPWVAVHGADSDVGTGAGAGL